MTKVGVLAFAVIGLGAAIFYTNPVAVTEALILISFPEGTWISPLNLPDASEISLSGSILSSVVSIIYAPETNSTNLAESVIVPDIYITPEASYNLRVPISFVNESFFVFKSNS